MSDWGAGIYGNPCRECGYDWTNTGVEEARALVGGIVSTYADLLKDADGTERHPDLAWSAKAYVSHVTDNLRIWAQRLAGAAEGADPRVSRYQADALAAARSYEALPLEGVMWSLGRSVEEWMAATSLALSKGVVLDHPDRGPQRADEVIVTNAHDARHHAWDIACCLGRETRLGSASSAPTAVAARTQGRIPTLYHFSDRPSIARFDPRPVSVPAERPPGMEWLNGPLVWAVSADRQATYLFPRDCPRILVWLTDTTTPEDRALWWGARSCSMLAHVEWSWLERIRSSTLYRYELLAEGFEDVEGSWMWVSREPVEPVEVTTIPDLLSALEEASVELRMMSSLVPLRDAWSSSLHVSGIRLRNAQGWA